MKWLNPSLGLWAMFAGWLAVCSSHAAEPLEAILDRWLTAQTNLHTFSAGFLQTRTLRSLAQPVTTEGRLWFEAPSNFRWELGAPPQTIALRQTNRLWVVYPPQKRIELYELENASSHWRGMLALLDAGFPRSRAELESRYRIERLEQTNDVIQVTLIPRSAAARRLAPEICLGFEPNQNVLRYTIMKLTDGSLMRQDFTNTVLNPVWTESPFVWTPPPGFEVTRPLDRTGVRTGAGKALR